MTKKCSDDFCKPYDWKRSTLHKPMTDAELAAYWRRQVLQGRADLRRARRGQTWQHVHGRSALDQKRAQP